MTPSLRQATIAMALATLATTAATAQSVFDSELRLAPQFMQYQLRAPAHETIGQLAVPLFATVPVSSRLTFDVGTSYARTRLTSNDGVSEISGLTDTQLRGNLTLGTDFVVLTAGLNLPTGKSSVTLDELAAAALIGSDFLAFPVANMGTGLAATGGVAVARPVGDWNAGFGGAVRRTRGYEPFDVPGQQLHYQPGNEYRARVGVDRTAGAGRVALGLTYSAFGKDDAGGSVYNTGNRLIAQSGYTSVISGNAVTLAAYNVFRGRGSFSSGEPAGRENIANLFASVGVHAMGTVIEPSMELRHWLQDVVGTGSTGDRSQSSVLATLGVRTRLEYAGVGVSPSIGYTLGSLATVDAGGAPARAGMTGFRAQVAMRVVPFGPE